MINLGLLIFINLLVKPFWIFGIDRTVQNVVGTEAYGLYFSLFNFSLILNILLDVGITNFNNRNISQNDYLVTKHFSNVVVLKFLLGLVYFVVSFLLAFIIGYDKIQIKLLLFLLFNQFLLSFILYMRSNLSALQYFTTDSIISVLDRLLMIIIVSVLLWGNVTNTPFKIEWFVYSQTIAYMTTAIIIFFVLNSKIDKVSLNFDFVFFLAFLKKTYPYALLILLMTFYYRIDSVMIERLLQDGKEQAGIYAQSFRVLDAISMFAFLFSTLLLPMFSRMIKFKENIMSLLSLSFDLLIVPAIIFSITSHFFANEIISLLYKSSLEESGMIFSVLMFSFVFISITYIYGTLLTANGSIKELNLIAGGGVVLNFVLNLILIKYYKAYGAAIASLITQAITALLQVFIARKMFGFKFNVKRIFVYLSFVFLVLVTVFVFNEFSIGWTFKFFTIIFVSLILSILLKLWDIKAMYGILRNE